MRVTRLIAILLIAVSLILSACTSPATSTTVPAQLPSPTQAQQAAAPTQQAPPPKTASAPTQIPSPTSTTTSVTSPETTPTLTSKDFLVIVSPNQISVTNNSKTTVRVIKSTVIYADYSYVEYNMPGKPSPNYGPIVTMSKTWDESTELKTGQTLYKTINLRNIVALRSCSFDVKDSLGRVFTITPLSVSPAPTPTVSPTSTPYTFKIEDFPIREQSPTQLTLTNNSPVKVYVYGVEFKTGTWRGWKEGVSAGSGRLALLESGQTYIYNYPSFVSAAPPALTFTIEFNTYDNNARKTYTIDFTPAPK